MVNIGLLFANIMGLFGNLIVKFCIKALPIHDAVIVGWTHVYKSKQVMEQVFLDMTNVPSVVKVE